MLKKITMFICVGLLMFSLIQCGSGNQSEKPVLKVAMLTWIGYGPIMLAKDKGFFEGIEVQIELIEDTAARRAAFTSGKVDASTDIVDSFTNLLAAGAKASAVLKLDDSMGGDGIVVKSDIQSITDLKGRTVAYPPGQPSHFFLLALFEDAGMTMADIETREMEPDQAGSAFISGSVDAAVTWEPWLTKAANMQDGKVLMSSRDKPGLIADIFTVRNAYLEANPEVVEAFIKGWFKAVEYWKANPKESNLIMANALKIDPKEFETMLAGVAYSDMATNKAFFQKGPDGESDFTRLVTKATRIWKQEGLIKNDVDTHAADGSEILMKLVQ